ncbi:MAG TPA: hypothetical protein VMY88_02460 [Acidimicrobiales bacterium]|nr:hypothetical protein [Acidimicrobiales bacterium]
MTIKRFLAAGTALGLLGLMGTAGLADAQAAGVGTSKASTTILNVDLGDALKLRVGGDDAQSSTDPQIGPAGAYSRLVGLEASSTMLPALNVKIPDPAIESRTPGGAPESSLAGVDLTSGIAALPGVALPASVASGTLDATLRSILDGTTAASSMDAAISNLGLAGGLVSAEGLSSTLATGASAVQADGARKVEVGAINVLDLGALLGALDMTLADLPIGTVSDLLASLGVPVAGVPQGSDLEAYVASLNQAINEVQATIDTTSQTVTGTVDSTVAGTLGSLQLPVPTTQSSVSQVLGTVDGLQDTLTGTLTTALNALDGLTLLRLDGATVGIATKAAQTVADSAADVTAEIGGVTVGGISLPGANLLDAASQVNELVGTVNGTLSGALSTIHPSLGNLVSVSVLDQLESVTADNGYIRSRAGITALTAQITPPAELAAVLSTIESATGIGETLAGLGAPVPALDSAMSDLQGTLGGITGILTNGATLKVADVQSASDFTYSGPAPVSELPRTGGYPAVAALAAILVIAAIGTRRLAVSTTR